MKVMRVGAAGMERPAVLWNGVIRDTSAEVPDYDAAFFASDGLQSLASLLDKRGDELPVVSEDERIGAPIALPRNLIGIGLNYAGHAAEAGMELSEEPVVFSKAPNTLIGPNDDVLLPPEAEKVDWEVELGVVIGRRARYLADEAAAGEHIAGYVLCNDVSERHFQLERSGQWIKGKSAETFNPAGPWLATRDELPDISSVALTLSVNGDIKQQGTTADMIFSPDHIVWYLSQFMVLEPGDLIDTGTPAGVGLGRNVYLNEGDIIELSGTGLGEQRQQCRRATR